MPPVCLPLMASNPIAGFLRSLFGGENRAESDEFPTHSVLFYVSDDYREAHLNGADPEYGPVRELEAACLAAIAAAGTGDPYDPGGFTEGYGGQFQFNGPDARALFASIEDLVRNSEITRGGEATLVFGIENNAAHEDIPLAPL